MLVNAARVTERSVIVTLSGSVTSWDTETPAQPTLAVECPRKTRSMRNTLVSVSIGDGQADSGQNHLGEWPECTTADLREGGGTSSLPAKHRGDMAFDPSDGSRDVTARLGPSKNLGVSQLAVT